MKNKNTIVMITFLLVLLAGSFFAMARSMGWFPREGKEPVSHDGREDLQKIYARYMGAGQGFDVSGTILLYDEEAGNALKEQTAFRNIRTGSLFYSQLSYQQTFANDSFAVQLDSVNKIIIVSKIDSMVRSAANGSLFPFEKYMGDTSVFKITATVTDNGAERKLVLKNELLPAIKSTTLFYDAATYTITRAEIEWWKSQVQGNDVDGNKCWLSKISYQNTVGQPLDIQEGINKVVRYNGKKVMTTDA